MESRSTPKRSEFHVIALSSLLLLLLAVEQP